MLTLFQVNYQFSPFVAEMANSFSNLITIFLGLYGGYVALEQKLPTRYPIGFLVCLVQICIMDRQVNIIPNTLIGHRRRWNRKLCLPRVSAVRSTARRRVADDYRRVVLALHLVRLTEGIHLRCRPWCYPPHRFQRSVPHLIVRPMTHSPHGTDSAVLSDMIVPYTGTPFITKSSSGY